MADEYVIVEKLTLDSIGDTVRNATGSTDSISVNNLNDAVAAAVTSGGILIDNSLTQSGYAADAKATGDAISSLSGNIVDLENKALFETDASLTLKDGVLSVNTTNDAEKDNTLPITSAGVYTQVGNIDVLLKTI